MESGRKITIYDVADRAGVSISTVSLAINSPHRVSERTRERVVAAAAALGYRSRASTGGSHAGVRVAVAAPFSSYPSYFRRFAGMLEQVRNTAVELVAYDLESAARSRSPLLDSLPARRGIDGLIVMGVPLGGSALRASREAALPVVFVDVRRQTGDRIPVPSVLVDDREGGRLVGAHLASRGHTKVVFLHEPQASRDYVSAGMLRAEGLGAFVEVVDVSSPAGSDLAKRLRRVVADAPTAIVANHDDLASRAWKAVSGIGVRVPDDVAIVGFDDGALADAMGLTTLAQPFEESGRTALDLLLAEVSGSSRAVRQVMLQPSLIVRSSA